MVPFRRLEVSSVHAALSAKEVGNIVDTQAFMFLFHFCIPKVAYLFFSFFFNMAGKRSFFLLIWLSWFIFCYGQIDICQIGLFFILLVYFLFLTSFLLTIYSQSKSSYSFSFLVP